MRLPSLALALAMIGCASPDYDSGEVSRSSIYQRIDRDKVPARQTIHNNHPAQTIRVVYRVRCAGGTAVKRTADIKAFEAADAGDAACEVKILSTDFVVEVMR